MIVVCGIKNTPRLGSVEVNTMNALPPPVLSGSGSGVDAGIVHPLSLARPGSPVSGYHFVNVE
jgi:hypothetical protein